MLKKLSIQPLFDNVLIKPLEAEDRTPSGILLPESAKEKPQIGQVMAVGPGGTDDKGNPVKMQVKVGQKIMEIQINDANLKLAKKAFKQAGYKLPVLCRIEIVKNDIKL